jgi:PAS domain S-box-containing protein
MISSAGSPPLLGRRRLSLPGVPASASRARRVVHEVLAAAGRVEWADAATLACTEVVSNVVLHAHTDLELTVEVFHDAVRVGVRDYSPVLPVQRDYSEQAVTGRGMALVAALASEHGISDVGPDGKVVWFTVTGEAAEQSDEDLLAAWDGAAWDVGEPLDTATVDPAQEQCTVRLLALPPLLWLAAREHHDALVRELGLHIAQHGDADLQVDVPAADLARATVSVAVAEAVERVQRSGAAGRTMPAGHPGPVHDVPAHLDLELSLPTDVVPAFAALRQTLDAAERLATARLLLSRPGQPEVVAVRDWVCEQVSSQCAGAPPAAWAGADQERFTVVDRSAQPGSVEWDVAFVRDSPKGVVAADDTNRIIAVSRSLADRLGWAVDDLVGRRVVTLIPQRLREAHVAGFTRHLTTGEAHLLSIPLTVPVLRADGTEITASLLVETAPTPAGRAVYLAWLEPLRSTPH